MEPLLVDVKDYGDGLRWWNMAYAAGYPDFPIESPLPPVAKDERLIWTGRRLVPLPTEIYETWLRAHSQPISLKQMRDMFRPYADDPDRESSVRELVRAVLDSGAFITWPWGYQGSSDTPDAIGLVRNPVVTDAAEMPNPLPDVIPDAEWAGTLSMNRLSTLWEAARKRNSLPGGLFDTVQDLLRDRAAWLLARPLPRGTT